MSTKTWRDQRPQKSLQRQLPLLFFTSTIGPQTHSLPFFSRQFWLSPLSEEFAGCKSVGTNVNENAARRMCPRSSP